MSKRRSKRKRRRTRRTSVTRGPRGSQPNDVPINPRNIGSGLGSVEEPYTGRGPDNRTKNLSDRVMVALRNLGGNATKAELLEYLGMEGRDSLRPALRYLVNSKRVGIDKSNGNYYRYFIIPAAVGHNQRLLEAGKIEARKCKGTTKDGSPCNSPDLFVRESGYCANHDPENPVRNGGRPKKKEPEEDIVEPEEDIVEVGQHLEGQYKWGPIRWKPNAEEGTLTLKIRREHMELAIGSSDDNLRQVVLDFLAGNATMKDLKEAVE